MVVYRGFSPGLQWGLPRVQSLGYGPAVFLWHEITVLGMCGCVQFLITCNIPFSAMIMVAIAVDRYLSICRPLVSALTSRRAWLVTAILGVFAAAIGICVALMYSVRHYRKQNSSNQSTSIGTYSSTVAERRQYLMSVSPGNAVVATTPAQPVMVEVDPGVCYPEEEVFSADFIWYFQKVYNGLFLVCFITVVVLYVLIYQSVLVRRNRRQRQRNMSMSFITSYSQRPRATARMSCQSFVAVVPEPEEVELQQMGNGGQEMAVTLASTTAEAAVIQAVRDRKRNRVANLKTAAMLFVVTVVFVVTFLPAFLMTVKVIPYNMIVFYMYFANNVANPIIYSFMNHNFRSKLKSTICRGNSVRQRRPNAASAAE